jgi:hypothetical protein
MLIEIVQKGQDAHQGVGYLADGTMVVVEQANGQIGNTVNVEVVRSLQTAAGKMMFARKIQHNNAPQQKNNKPQSKASSRQKPVADKAPAPTQPNSNIRSSQTKQKPSQRKYKRVDHEGDLIKLVENQK